MTTISNKELHEILYYLNTKYNKRIHWQFEPDFESDENNNIQLNWVEQYYFQNKKDIILYPRFYKENDKNKIRKIKDFYYSNMSNLFIFYNHKFILNLDFNDTNLKNIKMYNNVTINTMENKRIEIPIIEIYKQINDDLTNKEIFKILNNGNIIENNSQIILNNKQSE